MFTRFISALVFAACSCIAPLAQALDFIVNGQFNPAVSKGYKVQSGDTFGGYPIFTNDGDWRIYYIQMGSSTGGTEALRLPAVGMERYDENGKWLMGQWVTLSLDSSGTNAGWRGTPCSSDKIVQINIPRGRVDRCAASEIKSMKLGGVDTEMLRITFTETNTGGRYYLTSFDIHFAQLGLTRSEVTDKSSEFNRRLKDWMGKFLDATVKAAGYDKPPDAFKGIQTFAEGTGVSRIAKNTSPPPPSAEELRLENERKKLSEERARLDAEKAKLEQAKASARLAIQATATKPDADGDFVIYIQTSADTASLKINDEEQGASRAGVYTVRRVARVGEANVITIRAKDIYGNVDTKTISVVRSTVDSSSSSAQSQPSACQGMSPARWNNCKGKWLNVNGDLYEGDWRDGKPNGQGIQTFASGEKYTGTWKDGKYEGQGTISAANGTVISQGIWSGNQLIRPSNTATAQVSESQRLENERKAAQLEEERVKLAKERDRLDAEKLQREQAKLASRISIQATATKPDADGDFVINIQTSTDTASLKIDDEEQGANKTGIYTVRRVARVGVTNVITISGKDIFGNTDTKTVSVVRQAVDSRPTFSRLNPANIKPRPARDAVAIIIGIQNYKLIPKAEYANQDAQDFYNYASRALGIKQENIKLLLDDEADVSGILTAFQEWLPLKVRKGQTDVYVFYSGHGLPSPDGKSLYFLPVGANKNLVAKTAISQQELVSALQVAQPKSVTMFVDSCYSGQIRTGETLLASRPVVLKVEESAYPANFSVITASRYDQIASSSKDLNHGIFSYYLMKGLEGDADDNKDGTITLSKLQNYLAERVPLFAMTMGLQQQPQLVGDGSRVLVPK